MLIFVITKESAGQSKLSALPHILNWKILLCVVPVDLRPTDTGQLSNGFVFE